MHRAPGGSQRKRSSCRLSPFPHSPWRWPDGPPRRSTLPTDPRFAGHPNPTTGPRRPVAPEATGLSLAPVAKKRATALPSPLLDHRAMGGWSVLLGAIFLMAGAAGLAGILEGSLDRRHVARASRDGELVVRGIR